MDVHIANVILFTITGVAFVIWMIGFRFLINSARAGRPAAASDDRLTLDPPPSPNQIFGEAEVEGEPADLAARTARLLARGTASALGQVRILEQTDDRVVFGASGPTEPNRRYAGFLRQGEIRFERAEYGRTRIRYTVEISPGRWLLRAGAVVQSLGLVSIVAGSWAIHTWVVPNPHPAIRGQTMQMLQVVHFLWPPFLFGGLYRLRYRIVRNALDTLANNLPYLDA